MPSTTTAYDASSASVKHVNLMTDTFIANAPATELRAVIRALLSTNPSIIVPFGVITRTRLIQSQENVTLPPPSSLFDQQEGVPKPTQQFSEVLRHACMLFSAGLGIESLPVFTYLIRSTFPLRWTISDNDLLLASLTILDSDISQAVQSCRDEVATGFVQSEDGIADAKVKLDELYSALEESRCQVTMWGGEFCFDRGFFAVEDWRCCF